MQNPLPNHIVHVIEREKGKQDEQETPELDQSGESAGFTSSQFLHVTAAAQTTSMMYSITAQQKKLPLIESYKHQDNKSIGSLENHSSNPKHIVNTREPTASGTELKGPATKETIASWVQRSFGT